MSTTSAAYVRIDRGAVKRTVVYQWRLREIMAARGLNNLSDLIPLLVEPGIDLTGSAWPIRLRPLVWLDGRYRTETALGWVSRGRRRAHSEAPAGGFGRARAGQRPPFLPPTVRSLPSLQRGGGRATQLGSGTDLPRCTPARRKAPKQHQRHHFSHRLGGG